MPLETITQHLTYLSRSPRSAGGLEVLRWLPACRSLGPARWASISAPSIRSARAFFISVASDSKIQCPSSPSLRDQLIEQLARNPIVVLLCHTCLQSNSSWYGSQTQCMVRSPSAGFQRDVPRGTSKYANTRTHVRVPEGEHEVFRRLGPNSSSDSKCQPIA